MNIINTTVEAVIELLDNLKGATAVSVDTVTTPKLIGKHRDTGELNPWNNLRKIGTMSGLLGFSYENAVNNQRGREDKEMDFTALQGWMTPMESGCVHLVRKKSDLSCVYLRMKVQACDTASILYVNGTGEIVPCDDRLKGFLPKKYESQRQGTEQQIILRTISMGNVARIRMFGNEYVLGTLAMQAIPASVEEALREQREAADATA